MELWKQSRSGLEVGGHIARDWSVSQWVNGGHNLCDSIKRGQRVACTEGLPGKLSLVIIIARLHLHHLLFRFLFWPLINGRGNIITMILHQVQQFHKFDLYFVLAKERQRSFWRCTTKRWNEPLGDSAVSSLCEYAQADDNDMVLAGSSATCTTLNNHNRF